MTEAPSDSHRMSGFESLMWELERDPMLSSAFANLTLFDQAPDRKVFRARMEHAVQAVPRLRQRVATSLVPWELPRFVDDPDIDLDHHLRWIDLGGNATRRELYDLAVKLTRQPFDRERPLWEFVTIEGLEGGRAAMLQRLHHTITDGEGGIRLSVEFLDFERNPVSAGSTTRSRTRSSRSAVNVGKSTITTSPEPPAGVPDTGGPDTGGPWWSRAVGSIGSAASSAAVSAASTATTTVTWLPNRSAELAGAARSTLRQVRVGHRRSPVWTERSMDRWFATTTISLDDAKEAAHQLGGSVNDLFVTGAVDAAGAAHRHAGYPVDELRMSMPVSIRQDRTVGNAFAPTQMLVPTGEMDPVERLHAVRDIVSAVRNERAIDAMEGAAHAAAMLPSAAIVRTGQHLAGSVDFVCSNVRAAPFELFVSGAFMEANYPVGPLAGTAFNLTTMSYRGWLFLGLTVDTGAIDDPDGLLTLLDDAYDRLLATAGLRRRAPTAF